MSLIYGQLANKPEDLQPEALDRLKNNMLWPEAELIPIRWGNFSGGLLIDPRLPWRTEDLLFTNEDSGLLVMLSGTVYNREELLLALKQNNSLITTPTLLALAFQQWGENFVNELNGDFSLFVYNPFQEQAFLYRDHLGLKPMASHTSGQSLWFSSDSMALSKTFSIGKNINFDFVASQLVGLGLGNSWLEIDQTSLPNLGVHSLSPGHYLVFKKAESKEIRYWFPEKNPEEKGLTFETAYLDLKALVEDAVTIRSDRRFTVAAHVSGGLDSGIVSALVRKCYRHQKTFYGLSWSSDEKNPGEVEYDERVLAKKICDLNDIQLLLPPVDKDDYLEWIDDWRIKTDLFYEKKILKLSRIKGINLIFSGWGGDEFIGVYRGIDADLLTRLNWHSFIKKYTLRKPRRLLGALRLFLRFHAGGKKFSERKIDPARYSDYIRKGQLKKIRSADYMFYAPVRRRMHLNFMKFRHLDNRAEDWAIDGVRNGVEYRYPLLDKRIVEYMFRVPSIALFKGRYAKIMLREMGAGLLPEEVRWHETKIEPVRINHLVRILDEVGEQAMKRMDEFKENPLFGFIDFEKLEKDYKDFCQDKSPDKQSFSERFDLVFFLLKMDAFSRAYLSESESDDRK